jgi:hypothetical protein
VVDGVVASETCVCVDVGETTVKVEVCVVVVGVVIIVTWVWVEVGDNTVKVDDRVEVEVCVASET